MRLRRLPWCLLALAAAVSAFSFDARTAARKDDFSVLDAVVSAELKARQTPGAAVAIIRGDRLIYAKGFGVANVETGGAVTPEMLFRLGSTTKMLTAATLVSLAEAGKIDLKAPIGKYVRNLDPRLAALTAHQLLSQSSGLRDFGATVVSQDESALGTSIRTWKSDVFFTDPGKIYSYASSGYWLAGLVTEEVGGKPYAEMVREQVFQPLGMPRSTLRPLDAMTWPLALGHAVEGDRPVLIRPFFNNTAMWPGGSVFSSVDELSRFVIAMMNGGKIDGRQALPAAVVARLQTPQMRLPGDEEVNYGYGLMLYRWRGLRIVTHGGASRGYGSTIEMAPDQRFAVVVIANRSGETLPQTRNRAFELGLKLEAESEPTLPPAAILTSGELADFAGVYRHAPQDWEILARDGKLILKLNGKESPLQRLSRFRFTSDEGELVFVAGADGRIEHLFTGLYAARKERAK
jgi:CubicO group peptidase (beta-lactamase class C family)